MKLINILIYSTAVSSFAIGPKNDKNLVEINPSPEFEESFMDSIFGELVDDDNSIEFKQKLINNGKLKQSVKENANDDELLALFNNLKSSDISSFEQLVNQYTVAKRVKKDELYHIQSHEAFKRYKSKLNLPDRDDTSDIYHESTNMFGGILTFGHFPHFNCFDPKFRSNELDIGIVGAPFDTGTSYRPGARFGPEAIRSSGRRLAGGATPVRGNTLNSTLNKIDPYDTQSHNLSIIDCGDVPLTPFDNRIALNQLYRGLRSIYNHSSKNSQKFPKIITMGGDHTITLMTLKAAYERFGKITVLHFDSHIDTWDPKVLGGGLTSYMSLNHGTFLHYAHEQGYLAESNFHIGLRAPYISTKYDREHDSECGFSLITARDLDNLGRDEIIRRIKSQVGDRPVYISVDIDVLDPANAPGTGTMEIGGFTGRELLSLLDGLEGINLIGGDVVEVSPPYDTNGEITSLAATAVIDSLLGLIILNEIS